MQRLLPQNRSHLCNSIGESRVFCVSKIPFDSSAFDLHQRTTKRRRFTTLTLVCPSVLFMMQNPLFNLCCLLGVLFGWSVWHENLPAVNSRGVMKDTSGIPRTKMRSQISDSPTRVDLRASRLRRSGRVDHTEVAQVRAVAPRGWRKTATGWEHTSTWLIEPFLPRFEANESRRAGQDSSFILQGLRRIPPLAYAAMQIAMIAGVITVHRRRG